MVTRRIVDISQDIYLCKPRKMKIFLESTRKCKLSHPVATIQVSSREEGESQRFTIRSIFQAPLEFLSNKIECNSSQELIRSWTID